MSTDDFVSNKVQEEPNAIPTGYAVSPAILVLILVLPHFWRKADD